MGPQIAVGFVLLTSLTGGSVAIYIRALVMAAHASWRSGLPELPFAFERGFAAVVSEGLVCGGCASDPIVRLVGCDVGDEAVCRYCGGTTGPFAEVADLFEYVYRCLLQEYDDPWLHGIVPDKEAGGWIAITELDIWDVLAEEDCPLGDGGALAEAFVGLIDHDWYRIDSEAGLPEDRRIWGWESFEQRLLTGPRFLFSSTDAEWGEDSAEAVFEYLAALAAQIQAGFVNTHEPGLSLFRARSDRDRVFTTADELGSPPAAKTVPQRMSAAGVSCFYASEAAEIASAEIRRRDDDRVSIGCWTTTAPLVYVDFVTRPAMPSLFDYPASQQRTYISFLRNFVERIQRPASEELGAANSYLATQVLADYLRYSLPTSDRHGVDAVRYPSSIHPGGVNWVIFGQPDRESTPRVNLIRPHISGSSEMSGHWVRDGWGGGLQNRV